LAGAAAVAECKILQLMRIFQGQLVPSFVVLHAGLAVTFAVAFEAEIEFAPATVEIGVLWKWAFVVAEYVAVA
jgi:hypothetical protein